MKNGEKYKTAEERGKAFENYCLSRKHGCNKCELTKCAGDMCRFAWLELEYKEDIKPCPFCGSEKFTVVADYSNGEPFYYPRCIECGASVNTPSMTRKDAIEKWNRRAK